MKVFIGASSRYLNIYTIDTTEVRTDYAGRTLKKPIIRKSNNYHAQLRIDHEVRVNAVLKYVENSRIVSFGRDMEIEVENGDNLTKLEHILQVSLIYTEVKNILKGYSEGEISLDDAYVQLLPYVVAKSLVKP